VSHVLQKSRKPSYLGVWLESSHFVRNTCNKQAAFLLHQAVERYFACILLVYTNYRPKTHNIKALYSFATQQADELKTVFP
jgi:uncharacterized protein